MAAHTQAATQLNTLFHLQHVIPGQDLKDTLPPAVAAVVGQLLSADEPTTTTPHAREQFFAAARAALLIPVRGSEWVPEHVLAGQGFVAARAVADALESAMAQLLRAATWLHEWKAFWRVRKSKHVLHMMELGPWAWAWHWWKGSQAPKPAQLEAMVRSVHAQIQAATGRVARAAAALHAARDEHSMTVAVSCAACTLVLLSGGRGLAPATLRALLWPAVNAHPEQEADVHSTGSIFHLQVPLAACLAAAQAAYAGMHDLAGVVHKLVSPAAPPSRLRRTWWKWTLLLGGTALVARSVSANWQAAREAVDNTHASVQQFYREHMQGPLHAMWSELVRGQSLSVTDPREVIDASESLQNLMRDLLSSRAARGLNEMSPEAIQLAVQTADPAAISRVLEREIQHPVRGLIMGDLLQVMLVQVAMLKRDVVKSMAAMDALLRENHFNSQVAATVPAAIVLYCAYWIVRRLSIRVGTAIPSAAQFLGLGTDLTAVAVHARFTLHDTARLLNLCAEPGSSPSDAGSPSSSSRRSRRDAARRGKGAHISELEFKRQLLRRRSSLLPGERHSHRGHARHGTAPPGMSWPMEALTPNAQGLDRNSSSTHTPEQQVTTVVPLHHQQATSPWMQQRTSSANSARPLSPVAPFAAHSRTGSLPAVPEMPASTSMPGLLVSDMSGPSSSAAHVAPAWNGPGVAAAFSPTNHGPVLQRQLHESASPRSTIEAHAQDTMFGARAAAVTAVAVDDSGLDTSSQVMSPYDVADAWIASRDADMPGHHDEMLRTPPRPNSAALPAQLPHDRPLPAGALLPYEPTVRRMHEALPPTPLLAERGDHGSTRAGSAHMLVPMDEAATPVSASREYLTGTPRAWHSTAEEPQDHLVSIDFDVGRAQGRSSDPAVALPAYSRGRLPGRPVAAVSPDVATAAPQLGTPIASSYGEPGSSQHDPAAGRSSSAGYRGLSMALLVPSVWQLAMVPGWSSRAIDVAGRRDAASPPAAAGTAAAAAGPAVTVAAAATTGSSNPDALGAPALSIGDALAAASEQATAVLQELQVDVSKFWDPASAPADDAGEVYNASEHGVAYAGLTHAQLGKLYWLLHMLHVDAVALRRGMEPAEWARLMRDVADLQDEGLSTGQRVATIQRMRDTYMCLHVLGGTRFQSASVRTKLSKLVDVML